MTFRGRTDAGALLIAVPLIGEAEARSRVLALWSPGVTVHELPGGDWLVTLPAPLSLRAEHAPGLPLPTPAEVPRAGAIHRYDRTRLPEVDPAAWLDLGELEVVPLTVPEPELKPTPVEPSFTQEPDLRELASVGEPDPMPPLWPDGGLLGRVLRGWYADRRRRYVDRLAAQFERRRWGDALRNAVPLGGPGGGHPTLRLPGRRSGPLVPTPVRRPGGGSMPYDEDSHRRLRTLYRKAAAALEKDGRIEEAAFVLADLLDDALAAVTLLERHGRPRPAAELAEGRGLEPALVVRLWWRAGDRDRALRIARLRGAYEAAVERLAKVDPRAAGHLRLAWSADRWAAGDAVGAVEAAWPAEDLRAGAVSLARQGLDADAPHRPVLLAYALARRPDPGHADEARALLAKPEPDEADWYDQRAFVRTLRTVDLADRALDTELTGAALRAVLRAAPHETDPAARPGLIRALRRRADPLLAADLPACPPPPDRPVLRLRAERRPGGLPLTDAVALSRTTVLTAHGELGVRLLGRDGRVRAAWDVPAHRLIAADHGGAALLVADRGEAQDVHRLDLTTRRTAHWATLAAGPLPTSYDGTVLPVPDADGLAFLETRAPRLRALARELDRDHTVLALARTPDTLTALIRHRSGDQLRRWDLPRLTLRDRTGLPPARYTLLATGTALLPEPTDTGLRLRAHGRNPGDRGPLPADTLTLLADGDTLAVAAEEEPEVSVTLAETPGGRPWAGVSFPGLPRLRAHAGLVTLYEAEGRIVVLDRTARAQVLNVRTPPV
ncbi:hypothetical protein SRB5_38690 [Streptomyces sp. RB5]|uniref:MoxR-vWA-beta-propeller ternary system domain-containing protein n=1 Tax=Streptomyces smaragdinus TaxID=2585196 RepID=A0A7K0CJS8_9ACTN|nr:bpX6 domain-containing protein [Streptomyces smaragdinus]MQY13718.1 hypothetical protein [Streptomyces smaragdinus]